MIVAPASAPAVSSVAPTPAPPKQVKVEQLEVPGDLPAFIVRGKRGGERIVFVHGLCGNPYAYALSFRHAAARLGTMIAIQGNKSCGPGFRDWSSSPAKVDERIEAAFRASGDASALQDVIVIGYSSGGTFAELLVMRNPQRYSRAILIANPRAPALYRLRSARAVVMMAGERDRHDLAHADGQHGDAVPMELHLQRPAAVVLLPDGVGVRGRVGQSVHQ